MKKNTSFVFILLFVPFTYIAEVYWNDLEYKSTIYTVYGFIVFLEENKYIYPARTHLIYSLYYYNKKDHVTLKTGVMAAENHRTTLHCKIY